MLHRLTAQQIADLTWTVRPEPVLGPPLPSPVIADPTFLPPDQTPDGRWHLWAHSLLGLHAYRSADGITWRSSGTVTRNALRGHVVADGPGYRLSYEKTRLFMPLGLPWSSWIESRSSDDLESWSQPTVLLRPCLDWHVRGRDRAVSNPAWFRSPTAPGTCTTPQGSRSSRTADSRNRHTSVWRPDPVRTDRSTRCPSLC